MVTQTVQEIEKECAYSCVLECFGQKEHNQANAYVAHRLTISCSFIHQPHVHQPAHNSRPRPDSIKASMADDHMHVVSHHIIRCTACADYSSICAFASLLVEFTVTVERHS